MDTRSELLAAALTLFSSEGYDAAGVQRIVEAANVTKPTLYHYFGSKRGLFEALVQDRGEGLLADVRQATVYHRNITGSINTVVHVYFDYARRQPEFYRMLLAMWFAPPSAEYSPAVRALLAQQQHLLETMFERATEDHGNMRGRHMLYAMSLKGQIDTYIGLGLQGYVDLTSNDLVYRMIHQFMHGIFS
ncbi:TetR/AcrR family transcriptional regulator [Aggregatilinea lenta]|uniref:TetR/AcrR family transcriptional regulator n=1 Tax=Aggregatilinea lenta TaxID=913108 RepID=UPI000E5B311D|nr:TetR/AcrR family transcriptional regulator [Aggregatilinea lenta]